MSYYLPGNNGTQSNFHNDPGKYTTGKVACFVVICRLIGRFTVTALKIALDKAALASLQEHN